LIIFNQKNKSWAKFDDSITCFGYCQQATGETWENDFGEWHDDESTWDSDLEVPYQKKLIAGNQQGYTFYLDDDVFSQAPVLSVANISGTSVTVIDHNLKVNDFVQLVDCDAGITVGKVYEVTDDNTIKIREHNGDFATSNTYQGGGTLGRIARMEIKSKQWNPYIEKGFGVKLNKIDFCVSATSGGQVTAEYNVSSAKNLQMANQSVISGAQLGSNTLDTYAYDLCPLEANQDRLWHSVYFLGHGSSVNIHLYHTDEQMQAGQSSYGFTLEGMILHTEPSGDI